MELESLTDGAFHPTAGLGVLRGTFLAVAGGCVWYDVEGGRLLTQIPPYDHAFRSLRKAFDETLTANLPAFAAAPLPRYEGLPVLATPYSTNYFHVTLECASALRMLDARHPAVAVTPRLRQFPFQEELIGRCLDGRRLVAIEDISLHVDPILFYDYVSGAGIDHLRACMGLSVKPGNDFVYLERGLSNRRGLGGLGGIAETPDVAALLDRYGFRRVTFGSGELSVAEQAARLDGARVVLAPHGAAMTNLAYLNPPVTVIEVVPSPLLSCDCYQTVGEHLGFAYHRIVVERYDEFGNMLVNAEELDALLPAAA